MDINTCLREKSKEDILLGVQRRDKKWAKIQIQEIPFKHMKKACLH